jgi:hypothetical protein
MIILLYDFTLLLFLITLYYCVVANRKDRKRKRKFDNCKRETAFPFMCSNLVLCFNLCYTIICILPSHILLTSHYSLFSWLFLLILNHPSLPPLPSHMDSPMTCSLVLKVVTLVMVLLEISTKLLMTRESTPSLMTESFKEVLK